MKKLLGLLVALFGATGAMAQGLSEGEVRKIDKEQGKVTIKHGEIKNLDMPPMTMVFRAQPPGLLEKVQVGDKVRFQAEKIGSTYTVTALERSAQ